MGKALTQEDIDGVQVDDLKKKFFGELYRQFPRLNAIELYVFEHLFFKFETFQATELSSHINFRAYFHSPDTMQEEYVGVSTKSAAYAIYSGIQGTIKKFNID